MTQDLTAFLDGQPLELSRPTLLGAFERAVERAESAGRIVVEVQGDGSPLPEKMLAEPPDSDSGYSEVRFVSAEPRAMVRSILHDASDALDQLGDDQRQASEDIHAGRLDEARSGLERVTAVWQAVVMGVQHSAQLLDLDLNGVRVGDPPASFADHVGQLEGRLRELIAMLTNEDWSALADALEDEFVELAERWVGLLRALAERV